jgi:serine/threonine protein kinase
MRCGYSLRPTACGCLNSTPRCRADLSTILSKHVDVPLPWRLRCRIARDALQGIVALHENECIHRDIKSENFLVRAGCCGISACILMRWRLCGRLACPVTAMPRDRSADARVSHSATCVPLSSVCLPSPYPAVIRVTAVRVSRSSMTRGGAW